MNNHSVSKITAAPASKLRTSRASVSLSPLNRAAILRAAADFQTELFRVEAGFLPAVKRWELRREMAGLIFRDARRTQDLRTRCRELGLNFGPKHLSRATPGCGLIETLCHAPDAEAAFRAVFTVVKPRMREIFRAYLHDDLRVFDAPSLPAVEGNLSELDAQLEWAGRQEEIRASGPEDWFAIVEDLSGGLNGEIQAERRATADAVTQGRRIGHLPILNSVIPTGFRHVSSIEGAIEDGAYAGRALYHAHNFLWELQAADSCASLLFETPDMPWDFYFDAARHMWDEMRHCHFGELKLASLGRDIREMGLSNTAYVLRQTIDPLDRYAALTTQEADAFPGKHRGLQDAISNNDEIFARAWSYDIADETQHVRYGHKWIPVMIQEMNEVRSYDQLKRDAENWRKEVLGAVFEPARAHFAARDKDAA